MDISSKVTVDRSYFEALLRRADFHTSSHAVPHTSNISISRAEYDSLIRTSREYQTLKAALFQGGITEETLNLLISGSDGHEPRKDSVYGVNTWDDGLSRFDTSTRPSIAPAFREMPWKSGGRGPTPTFNLAPGTAPYTTSFHSQQQGLRVPPSHRHVSNGMTSVGDDFTFEDDQSVGESQMQATDMQGNEGGKEQRTLYFSGLSDRTTYRDLLSVIKGGKILNVNLRSERTATVSFLDGAAEFLAWAKKNDIYLLTKRVEVKWADRQFYLNPHTTKKIENGATRNILVRHALDKGLTESRIRDDMEHIHNLIIVDITYRGANAYVSTNSVHNAMFARTCIMSRTTYRGCKIEFYADECDTPLPARTYAPKPPAVPMKKKAVAVTNRFGMLDLDGIDSDEENRTPSDHDSSGQDTETETEHAGVSLSFLQSDRT